MVYILFIFFVFLIYLILEKSRHKKNLNALRIRIHVNGSRGKSSVTRLIAAGLREGGIRTFAKTTGTMPRMIFPDGFEEPVDRKGSANIIEQKRIIRTAIKKNSEAIVFECMSLKPELQFIEANKLINPNFYVITNVRSDHLDVMGPTISDSANYMVASVPKSAVLFTAENQILPEIRYKTRKNGIKMVFADADGVKDNEMENFDYVEHKENVALALSVIEHLGVDRNVALKGMYDMKPDPGALRIYKINDFGKEIHFINAMAANDPDSTKLIWDRMKEGYNYRFILINCRADRIGRSKQLAELCAQELLADKYILTGSLTKVFRKRALSVGINKEKILELNGRNPSDIYREVLTISRDGTLIFAIGNIVIFGYKIVDFFASKAVYDS